MKIAIVSRSIYPKNAPRPFRATELAKYFAKLGHDVTLYGSLGSFDYTTFEESTGVKVCTIGKVYFSTLNSDGYMRNNFFDKITKKLFGRLLEYPDIELMWKIRKLVEEMDDVDLLITIAIPYPIHWGAAWAKKRKPSNFPSVWISDCGDPYMGNSVGMKHPSYFQYIEDFWGDKTDYITIPIDHARMAYSPKVQSKLRVIPQGFDFSNVVIDKAFKGNSVLKFAYAGATYPGYRDPSKMLEFLSSHPELNFQFVVYTQAFSHFEKYKEQLGDKLVLKNYVPREQLIYELSKMDFLVNIKNNSSVQSPSKLIDYYLTNRPIIDITSDFSEIEVLKEFLNGDYSNRHKPTDISEYDINNVGAKFLGLYEESFRVK